MDIANCLALLALILSVGYWAAALRVREEVMRRCLDSCRQLHMQLLEDSVACMRTGIVRSAGGHLCLRRIYHFEFSRDGVDRNRGEVEVLAGRVAWIRLAHPDGAIIDQPVTSD